MNGSNGSYIKYSFFKSLPEWRRQERQLQEKGKQEFLEILREYAPHLILKTYSLVGVRGDCDFLLWLISPTLDTIQDMTARLLSTTLGKYLTTPYSYLAMTRRSEYIGGDSHLEERKANFEESITNAKYLFVYPFTKKREWYKIPYDERRLIMAEHFKIGHKYTSVKIHTAYSYGLDDQEFMLSFETNNPADFLDLVMDLRSSDASKYTELETPIFTCVAAEPEKMLNLLG